MPNSVDEPKETMVMMRQSPSIDLWNICDLAFERVAGQARLKQVDLGCWVRPEAEIGFLGDANRLDRIVGTLLGTAVLFSQSKGEILVHVSVESEDERAAGLRFEISGGCINVPEETAQWMDSPHGPLPSDPVLLLDQPEGGWAISRELVREAGGEIGFEGAPEIGSTFWFTIRLEKRPGAGVSAKSLPFHGLILGSQPMPRRILSNQLRALGLHTVSLGDVDEAAGLPDSPSDRFDVVFLDLSMPLLESLDVAAAVISKTRLTDGGAVVVLLPREEAIAPEVLKERGVSRCLVKPVLQRQLAEVVGALGNSAEATPAAPEPALPQAAAPVPEKKRVLVVEDDDILRKIAVMLVSKLEVDVDAAADGPTALSMSMERRYDLILMDCQLPGMDGYEVTQKIREHEAALPGRRTRILAMTNDPLRKNNQKCLDAGMDDFLSKPLRRESFHETVTRWLSQDSPPQAAVARGPVQPVSMPLPGREPVVDLRRLWDCAGDDRQELRRLLETYFHDIEVQLTRIGALIGEGGFLEISRCAHRSGGSSATLGMSAIVPVLRALESKGADQTADEATSRLAHAREQLVVIREFIKTQPETASCYPM